MRTHAASGVASAVRQARLLARLHARTHARPAGLLQALLHVWRRLAACAAHPTLILSSFLVTPRSSFKVSSSRSCSISPVISAAMKLGASLASPTVPSHSPTRAGVQFE